VEINVAVPEDYFEAAEERSSGLGVPFVELGFHGPGRGERHRFSAEPGRKDEGADYRHGVEWRHPHLCASVALCEAVAGGEIGDPLI